MISNRTEIVERYAQSESPAKDKLELYYYAGCPFCTIAMSPMKKLGVEVELRNIHENPLYREDLLNARGRVTVPVLRITSPDGEERWLPESRDIVHYIVSTYS
jgi:glutaredoxin 2